MKGAKLPKDILKYSVKFQIQQASNVIGVLKFQIIIESYFCSLVLKSYPQTMQKLTSPPLTNLLALKG